MGKTDRLVARKARLTLRLAHADMRRHEKGREVRNATWTRLRLHRVDTLLEREGMFQ